MAKIEPREIIRNIQNGEFYMVHVSNKDTYEFGFSYVDKEKEENHMLRVNLTGDELAKLITGRTLASIRLDDKIIRKKKKDETK